DVRLTVLSPQGLIAPAPRGWSVLIGVDLQSTSPIAAAILRIPLSLLAPASSLPVTAAVWDEASEQWIGGPAAALDGNALAVALTPLPSPGIQLSFLVADTQPAAPSGPVEGQPIAGVSSLLGPG